MCVYFDSCVGVSVIRLIVFTVFLYCLYCVFVLFLLRVFILTSFVFTSVRTTATELKFNCRVIIIIIIITNKLRTRLITHNDAPRSIGLLWTINQFVAETST
jgi:hypothetical protein